MLLARPHALALRFSAGGASGLGRHRRHLSTSVSVPPPSPTNLLANAHLASAALWERTTADPATVIDIVDGTTHILTDGDASISQQVPNCFAGHAFALSVWGEIVSVADDGYVNLTIEWYDAQEILIDYGYDIFFEMVGEELMFILRTAPEETVSAKIIFGVGAGAEVYLRYARLEKSAYVTRQPAVGQPAWPGPHTPA